MPARPAGLVLGWGCGAARRSSGGGAPLAEPCRRGLPSRHQVLWSKSQPCHSSTAGGQLLWMDWGRRELVRQSGRARECHGRFVHPPPRPHRVLDARRCRPRRGGGGGGRRRRAAGDRHHRPRQHVRRPALLQGGSGVRHQAHRRLRAVHGPRPQGRAHQRPWPGRRHRWRGRGRPQALLPPDRAGRDRAGVQEPDPALQPGLPGGLLPQAQGRLGPAGGAQRRGHRHHRLPRWPRAAGADPARPRP